MGSLLLPRDGITPSYAAGFARSAGESANPGLWAGLAAAWCPALGITGNLVPDVIGEKTQEPSTWTPDTGWVVRQGTHAIYLDGTNEFFDSNLAVAHNIGTGPFTWLVGVEEDGLPPTSYSGIMGSGAYYPGMYVALTYHGEWGGYWVSARSSGSVLAANTPYSLAMRRIGTTLDFWQDGVRTPSQSASVGYAMANDTIHVGTSNATANVMTGWIRYAYIYRRALTPAEMMQIHVDLFAPFRLAPMYVSVPDGAPAVYPQQLYGSRNMDPLIQM